MPATFHIKRNDEVVVISGSHKGKSGKVLEILASKQRARIEELEAVLPEAQLVLRLSDSPDHLGESSMQFERALMRLNEAVNHPQQHTIRAMTQGTFDEPEQPKPAAP